jgi:hypothetical protein
MIMGVRWDKPMFVTKDDCCIYVFTQQSKFILFYFVYEIDGQQASAKAKEGVDYLASFFCQV